MKKICKEPYKKVFIPKWAMKALCTWAERAYRRGFQHGLVAAERHQWNSEQNGYSFRYDTAGGINPKDAREPLHKMRKVKLEERHLEWDNIPFVDTNVDKKGMTLTWRNYL